MSKASIQIGDRVRFIMSYDDMMKEAYLFPSLMNEPDPQDTDLMLGGEYTVQEVRKNKWGVRMFKLLIADSDTSWVPEGYVYPANRIQLCPFTVGDELLFRPRTEPEEIEAVTVGDDDVGFADPKTIFVLRQIINSYYVKVERPGVRVLDFPFKWIDFIKA